MNVSSCSPRASHGLQFDPEEIPLKRSLRRVFLGSLPNVLGAKAQQSLSVDMQVLFLLLLLLCWLLFFNRILGM